MPWESLIEAAGAFHDVMARDIERGTVFRNDADRNQNLERLGEILQDTKAIWCTFLVRKLGVPKSSLSHKHGISIPSVIESVTRVRRIAETIRYILLETQKRNSGLLDWKDAKSKIYKNENSNVFVYSWVFQRTSSRIFTGRRYPYENNLD